MSKWKTFVSKSKTVNNARKTATKAKNKASEVKQNGVGNTLKSAAKDMTAKQMRMMAKPAAQAVFKFLITPPVGWIVSALLIFGMMKLIDASGGQNLDVDTAGNSQMSVEEYVTMMNSAGCATEVKSTGKVSGSINLQPGQSKFSLQEVRKFASASISSTWGVSDADAANYFLARNPSVATRYGLNKSNIGEITAVVKKAGVSPTFFYLYAVNEGGGAGGYINHYFQADMTGDKKLDAQMDADYLVQYANMGGGKPAVEEWSLPGMPTDHAAKELEKMPDGSVGRVYIQATAATTAEFEDLNGHTGSWSGKFGKPVTDMMAAVTTLGGDINSGEQIAATPSDDELCAPDNISGDLKSGGLTLEEAQKFMMEKYKNIPLKDGDYPGALPGTPTVHDNCTTFTAYFLHKFTSVVPKSGNGGEVVANLLANHSYLKASYTPTAYSVFSIQDGGGPGLATGPGHTGIVLGVDTEKGVAIIGQAMYGQPFTSVTETSSGVNAVEWPLKYMTKEYGWIFTDVSEYVTGLK